jgi:hypothetical protein
MDEAVKKLVFLFVSEEFEAKPRGNFMDLNKIEKALEDDWMDWELYFRLLY